MGTVFKWRNTWYVNYSFEGERHKIAVGKSKKKAMDVLKKIEADIVHKKFSLPVRSKMTFEELAEYWLKNYSEISNSPSHYQKNRERLGNHLIPFFGNRDINQITPRMIDEYKMTKHKKLSPATINRTLAILRKMFNDAIRWGFMNSTPMKFVKQLKEDENGFDYYSEDETRLFLKSCSENFSPIAICAVYTGMRIGEIVALEWKNVDFERRIIVVKRSFGGRTKSGKVRYVPINSKLLSILEACKENRKCDLVFPDRDGSIRSIDFRTEMKRVAKKAEIRRIRMHDLRHTFASNYVIKGGNILSLQKILGHSTINMTLRYAHLAPEFMARDIELLDFGNQTSPIRPQGESRIC